VTHVLQIPSAPPALPARWRRAVRALRDLLADPDRTELAVDLVYALGTRSFERNFQRFARSEAGRRLLAERPSLLGALSDREALARLPEASLGRAYLRYLEQNGFEPDGLLAVNRRVQERWEDEEGLPALDPLRAWFRDRNLLAHDLFHVLTDYGTDEVGEATLLAFSLAQLGGRANALLTAGAAFEGARALGLRWLRYDFRAWRRGRRSSWLMALPWEDLLPTRLDVVRELAGLASSEAAHPDGILRGRIDDGHVFTPA
jgi:ubiquinone biosynthesis protein COQ4